MTKPIIRGDGNGCLIVSKILAVFIAFITLTSLIWGIATSYSMQTNIAPMRKDVDRLGAEVYELKRSNEEQKLQAARMESKIDLLTEYLKVMNESSKRR